MLTFTRINSTERGILYRHGDVAQLLEPGFHRYVSLPFRRVRIDRVSTRPVDFTHKDLDLILRRAGERSDIRVLELRDEQRALVWVDGRFHAIYGPGRHALWQVDRLIDVEIVDTGAVLFAHRQLPAIINTQSARAHLDLHVVPQGHLGLLSVRGAIAETLTPGLYAAWKQAADYKLVPVEMREQGLDVDGQDIMTVDKVSLRVNAHLIYRVTDPVRTMETVVDTTSAVYRAAQLALRAVIGTRDLDTLLADRDAVAAELQAQTRTRVRDFGVDVLALGLRDVILPGEMKTILNRVTEARKAAEAALITRREEVAAARSQANTAKILAENPVLMRLRELEVLEKVAEHNKLSVMISDKGLADKITNLI